MTTVAPSSVAVREPRRDPIWRQAYPRLLTRYVVVELLQIFLAALLVLTLVIMIAGVAQEAIRQGLSLGATLRLLPYMLPNALCFSVPGTLLYTVCCVYGRMSADNEIVALKSLGISPLVVVTPTVVLALVLSLCTVFLIDLAFSWGYFQIQRVILESADEIAYGVLRSHGTWSNDEFSISVTGVDGRRLLHPTINAVHGSNDQPVTATAREAELRISPAGDMLYVQLTQGSIRVGDNVGVYFPDTLELPVPLGNGPANLESLSPSHIAMRDISRESQREWGVIRQLQEAMAAEAGFEMIAGDYDSLGGDAWRERQQELQWHQTRLNRLRLEPHRRWASGFSCLCFVLVGIPLAIRRKNANYITVFGMVFLPILLCYYPLFAWGLNQAKQGAVPPQAVWLGNIVCAAIGLWLLRKVIRY